ncbi:enoyl-CoA hydratase/isomerase family protein [Flavobacterium gawalongense]|uniref:Enoyl-CoA hydratase/isomerase family protein n=1 Tax=Flavobacterium gawalongense TaxID=2594432 RepID=A0A553B9K3_9FLAO|nr:enoyl-CoA hydratase/isomerase family protein [Flavobacterium gawalongense]TRW96125.1 enoyl-CoA hydratase/isomerase family protein [Flavobacterium gawalongense]TRX00798.1 enoyl-CoA hydratase/isomerase family protein [Flavobacterium gawalongense]TRX04913.1 enoyl-CoA hydratase/isomerase family protein [Flavobacterium gawalongense]TRX05563.1 enoyl-CoA hydratase/isomerase family protein [Flavobacterium gawalongense]TRX21436.1 enoyl-CoA hydratase/isomerase family protein [Flavobacterium gawalonge
MVTEIPTGSLITTIENKIATLEFGHPASNSFPRELLDRLTNEFNSLSTNPAVSVIVVKSEGMGAFCAGASFDELLAVSNQEEGTRFFSGFAHLINAMRNCSKLIVGRIHGKAVGGGVGIASACDYTLATKNASIKLSELAIGIGPFVIEPAVSRKIGKMAMAEMTLAAHEWKTGDWAKEKGLYANTFETIEVLDAALAEFSTKLASYNPEALSEMKKVLWEGTQDWETLLLERATISGRLVLSDFTKKALSQFKK